MISSSEIIKKYSRENKCIDDGYLSFGSYIDLIEYCCSLKGIFKIKNLITVLLDNRIRHLDDIQASPECQRIHLLLNIIISSKTNILQARKDFDRYSNLCRMVKRFCLLERHLALLVCYKLQKKLPFSVSADYALKHSSDFCEYSQKKILYYKALGDFRKIISSSKTIINFLASDLTQSSESQHEVKKCKLKLLLCLYNVYIYMARVGAIKKTRVKLFLKSARHTKGYFKSSHHNLIAKIFVAHNELCIKFNLKLSNVDKKRLLKICKKLIIKGENLYEVGKGCHHQSILSYILSSNMHKCKDGSLRQWFKKILSENHSFAKKMSKENLELVWVSPGSRTNVITLFCPLLNDAVLLPEFINYHRSIGVEQFVFIDNGSTDNPLEYLSIQPDVALYQSKIPFKESLCGTIWVEYLRSRWAINSWCLMVDTDEFIEFQGAVSIGRKGLIDYCEEYQHNVVGF